MTAPEYHHRFSEEEWLFSPETLRELRFTSTTGFNLKAFH